ncbi:MAG TPA: lysophospholipid acyltransferase family protein [Gemmatimonadales bacterium]|nr:lysophospholipid acyltransferase family protein [Gemmatimonadales bacterium]
MAGPPALGRNPEGAVRLTESLRPTIPPRPWVAAGFERYLRHLAARQFAAVHVRRPAGGAAPGAATPTIFVANHTNWWDGFLAYLVGRSLGTTFYVLMEARHLARYRFFLRVGALPLDRTSAPRAYADLERARGVLAPSAGLWVFPQGARRPAAEPLATLEAGAAHLALTADTPVRICPVGFRYGYLGEHLPEAFAWVGESWVVRPGSDNRRTLTEQIGERLSAVLEQLDAARREERLDEFRLLVRGSISLNKRLDRIRHRLGWLDGPYEERNG